ncbi:hypothetical protein VPH35_080331 [Triticum aestivum]|uniref:G-type lectin S-receptor-like serine/threonine-protein kinase At4g27290 n=1 Tax=Triticum aestivum TaxID=4565 RepID=UPI001D011ABD|nr:G-type lectin S-receptor-like serine/threonine-protein kinase At4g27290 [Triticum aestivum]
MVMIQGVRSCNLRCRGSGCRGEAKGHGCEVRRARWLGMLMYSSLPVYAILLLLSWPFSLVPLCASHNQLVAGKLLFPGSVLVYQDGVFALGFFSPSDSTKNHHYVGIRYDDILERTVVWVSNRAAPITTNLSSANLVVASCSNIVLSDSNGHVLWTTNNNISVNSISVEAVLDNTGNFILRSLADSAILWQSFDHSANTLLPGMNLRLSHNTLPLQDLVSWKGQQDPSTGHTGEARCGQTTSMLVDSTSLPFTRPYIMPTMRMEIDYSGKKLSQFASALTVLSRGMVKDGSPVASHRDAARRRCEGAPMETMSNMDIDGDGTRCLGWMGDLIDMENHTQGGENLYVRTKRLQGNMRKITTLEIVLPVVSSFLIFICVGLIWIYASRGRTYQLSCWNIAWSLRKDGKVMDLIDSSIIKGCSLVEALRCIHIGLLSVQDDPDAHPLMSWVVASLDNEDIEIPQPKEPMCFAHRNYRASESHVHDMSLENLKEC